MAGDTKFRRLRGAFRTALVWGAAWAGAGFAIFSVLHLTGIIPDRVPWVQGVGLAARFGLVGFVSGGAFSSIVRLLYHGRRLRDINWVRFGLAGGIVTAVFVPLFLQAMNLLSDGRMVPWRLVLDDSIWTGILGAVAAGGSLKLAQRGERLSAGEGHRQLDAHDAESDRIAHDV